MSAAREKDQADFDLERFVDMFDEALTSDAKLRAAAVLAQLGIDDEETSAYLLRAVGSL